MFDFPVTEVNVWCPTYCLIMYLFILLNNYHIGIGNAYTNYINTNNKKGVIIIVGIFIITHCLQGDFFAMMRAVHNYSAIPGAYNYGEPFYQSLGLFLEKNYILFRTVVFGSAFGLFCLTARRMGIPIYYAVIFLLASYIMIFSYARATLAMAVYFFGLSFLCKPLKGYKFIGYIIGIGLILLSRYFHNSAIIMMMMTLAILVPTNKKIFILLLISTPILLSSFSNYFYTILDSGEMGEDITAKLNTYNDLERDALGISGYMINTLQFLSFYIPLALTSKCIFKHKFKVEKDVLLMYKVMIGLLYISVLFYFLGSTFFVYVYRVLFMTMIPIVLVASKLHQKGYMDKKTFLWCIKPGITFMTINYIYSVYCIIVST